MGERGAGRRPPRRGRSANPITSHLSYWTDNGAAYWYRTEPGRTIGASVAEAVEALRADGVPVHAVELDSWCYQHEVARPIAEIGYPEEVPPSGMMLWEPRADAFDPAVARARPDRAVRRAARPPAAGDPRAAHLARVAVPRRGRVVGRRARRPAGRPDVLPAMVRRRPPLGRVRHRAGLDADVLVRRARPARRARPGRGVAAGARRAGRRVRRSA